MHFTDEAILTLISSKADAVPYSLVKNAALSGSSGSGVPNGAIIMWSGTVATIPDGFSLCDGSNGTPDLRNRFVIGAGGTYAVGATGGSSATTQVGDVEAGPQATVSTSALPPYYALCYIMKT